MKPKKNPPNSSLLEYEPDDESNKDHFFNPNARMEALKQSTISKRFLDREGPNVSPIPKKQRGKKMPMIKEVNGNPRMSTRVRVSSFFSTIFSRKNRESQMPNSSVVTVKARKKKRNFFQKLFGLGKRRTGSKYIDDIYEINQPNNSEHKENGMLPFGLDGATNPTNHMRATQIFTEYQVPNEEHENIDSELSDTEIIQLPALDVLSQADRMRDSEKHQSMFEGQAELPPQPPKREPVYSFVGSGKDIFGTGGASRVTLKQTTLPKDKKKKNSSFYISEVAADAFNSTHSMPRTPVPTLKGEDLKVTEKEIDPLKSTKSSGSKKVPSFQASVDLDARVLSSRTSKHRIPSSMSIGRVSANKRQKSILQSSSNASLNRVNRKPSTTSTMVKSKKSVNKTMAQDNGADSSGVWNVEPSIAHVLASHGTLKRKKKKQSESVMRESAKRVSSLAKTEASHQDLEMLNALASPAQRKKASFSSFISLDPKDV